MLSRTCSLPQLVFSTLFALVLTYINLPQGDNHGKAGFPLPWLTFSDIGPPFFDTITVAPLVADLTACILAFALASHLFDKLLQREDPPRPRFTPLTRALLATLIPCLLLLNLWGYETFGYVSAGFPFYWQRFYLHPSSPEVAVRNINSKALLLVNGLVCVFIVSVAVVVVEAIAQLRSRNAEVPPRAA